jgi:hypothetical protein
VRVIVLIEWGPKRWHKAVLEPGRRLRVGRHERADLAVPHDEAMSGQHFELTWDGSRCGLSDLASARGTSHNGQPVTSAEVSHGDWIQAGETTFSIYFEGQVGPFLREGAGPGAPPEAKSAALTALRSQSGRLHAVLDAAREQRILTLLRASVEEVRSLYDGTDGEELSEVAPHLVSLPPGSWLLERLVAEGWGEGWGIYLTSRRPFLEVRRQLRRLLLVHGKESGEMLYFRFYDPKALSAALTLARGRQRQQIFGDVDAFLVEGGPGGEALRILRRDDG